jgi:hypothetical protein
MSVKIVNIDELAPPFKVFRCYSPNLKSFLVEHGVDYIYLYQDNSKNKTVWVFIECTRLSQLLVIWKENRPEKEVVSNGE